MPLILLYVVGLVGFVCWIMTLVKIFQDKEKNGVLHGILGIICGLWAFIWGWMNSSRYGNKNVMLAWTVAWIIQVILYFVVIGAAVAAAGAGAGTDK